MLSFTRTRFHAFRLRLETHQPRNRRRAYMWEFCIFVLKQAWACLFGGLLLASVLLTKWFWPAHSVLARYDFLFLAALLIQVLLLTLRLETLREAKVILVFHLAGTAMELFKTHVGSWQYPASNLLRLGGVPLFSGFMYASVGSYLARATRIFHVRYTRYPPRWAAVALAVLIYANFFTHHFIPDLRLALFSGVALLFGRTFLGFTPHQQLRRMPLLVGFGLVAVFVYLAENVSTFANVWVYPQQRYGWRAVPASKFGSWYLLVIISFVLVSFVTDDELSGAAS